MTQVPEIRTRCAIYRVMAASKTTRARLLAFTFTTRGLKRLWTWLWVNTRSVVVLQRNRNFSTVAVVGSLLRVVIYRLVFLKECNERRNHLELKTLCRRNALYGLALNSVHLTLDSNISNDDPYCLI